MDLFDLASQLFPSRTNVGGTTPTVMGTAQGASSDGAVEVVIGSDVTNPDPVEIDGETYYADAGTAVEMPTSPAVAEGDDVLVALVGDGPLKTPMVIGVAGSGDRMQDDVDGAVADAAQASADAAQASADAAQASSDAAAADTKATSALSTAQAVDGKATQAQAAATQAEALAQQALDVAEASGQYVWHDEAGTHTTMEPRDDWETNPTGANSLLNALGLLFRDALNNLLAIIAGQETTETFTLATPTNEYYLASAASSVIEVTNGSATVDPSYYYVETSQYGASYIWIRDAYLYDHNGETIAVKYRDSPALNFYDGLGNAAANIVASFTSTVIDLGRNSRNAVIKLVGGTGRIRAINNGTNYVLRVESDDAASISAGDGTSGEAMIALQDNSYAYLEHQLNGYMAHIGVSASGNAARLNLSAVTPSAVVTHNPTIADVIAALQKVPVIGQRYYKSASITINTANSDKSGPSVTVPAGNYLVTVTYTFPAGAATGARATTLGFKAGSVSLYSSWVQGSNARVRLTHVDIVEPTATTTYTAFVNSSTTSSANTCYITALRFA